MCNLQVLQIVKIEHLGVHDMGSLKSGNSGELRHLTGSL